MSEEQPSCHVATGTLTPQVSRTRYTLVALVGLGAALALVLMYLGIVTWAQGWSHATELLWDDRAFVGAIAGGFGIQAGLYGYLRLVVHHGIRMAAPTAATGAGTGASSTAMVACCLHHVTDVLPVLGLSGAAVFLNDYRVPIMLLGLAVNLIGIGIMLRVVLQGRGHMRAMAEARA